MRIIPKDHADSYKSQSSSSFVVPPSGTYIVANTKIVKQVVGANNTPRFRFRAVILAHVESANNEGAAFAGKSFTFDLWANWEKVFNVNRISHLGIACGQTEAWDPDEVNELVKATTAVPYQLKLVRKDYEYDGKARQDTDVVEFKAIGTDGKAKFTKSPDWSRIVGNAADRYEDAGTGKPGKAKSTAPAKAAQPDPFKDDDIPF